MKGAQIRSKIYREEAKEIVKEKMKQEPSLSLTQLSKETGYSKPFLACIYCSVRKSNEWKEWKEMMFAKNDAEMERKGVV